MSKMSEEELRNKLDELVFKYAGGIRGNGIEVNELMEIINQYTQEKCREVEIALLRETAEGFQLVLEPEFAKGGQAAINALIKMADHKEGELQAQLKENKS